MESIERRWRGKAKEGERGGRCQDCYCNSKQKHSRIVGYIWEALLRKMRSPTSPHFPVTFYDDDASDDDTFLPTYTPLRSQTLVLITLLYASRKIHDTEVFGRFCRRAKKGIMEENRKNIGRIYILERNLKICLFVRVPGFLSFIS